MGRLIAVVFLIIACATAARAQQGPQTSQNQAILYALNKSVTLNPSFPAQTCTFTVSQVNSAQYNAPFVGTVTFSESGDGSTFTTIGSASSPGNYVYSCGGYYTLKATMTSYTSGGVTVLIVASPIGLSAITTASGIVPNNQAQATFGGTYPYIFPSGIAQTNIVGPVFNVTNAAAYGSPSSGNWSIVVQNAVNAAGAAGGGTVYFPCYGSYGIGGSGVTLTSADANVIIEGCGSSSVIQPLSTLTGPAFTAYETNDVTFRNLECQSPSATAASNVAQPCIENAGSSIIRYENLNGFYNNAPLIKMIGVNAANYAFVNLATNVQCQQSVGCVYGDDSASDIGQAAPSLTFIGTNVGANNQLGSTDAFYFKDSHDIFLNNPYTSWGFGTQTGTGNAIHIVGDTGPLMVTGYDGGGGTGAAAFIADANFSGDLTPPARVMFSDSIFEFSPTDVVINAGQQFGFNNSVFEYTAGTSTYPCTICVASGVLDVRVQGNSFNNNGNGTVSPYYDIKNASANGLFISGNTFLDSGIAALVYNSGANFTTFNENNIGSTNALNAGTKPYQIRDNIDPYGTPAQDHYYDTTGDSFQTGFLETTANGTKPTPNVQGAAFGWNYLQGPGEADVYSQFVNASTTAAAVAFVAPNPSSTYTPYGEVMRNGGYYDPILSRYALEFTQGATNPTHPQEIENTVAYSASPTTITFPGSFAFANTAFNCGLTNVGTVAASNSYVVASTTSITIYSSVTAGSMTYDCKQ